MADQQLVEQMSRFERVVLDRDDALADAVLHPAFALVLIQPVPTVMPRSRWLEVLPDYVVHSWQVEEQQIHVEGDCAAVLQRVTMNATVLGGDRSGIFAISDVWLHGSGEWLVWRRHSTPLTAAKMPGVSDT